MYLLFLDAGGHSEFPPPYGRGKDTYVLARLAINAERWFEAYTGLNQLCKEYFPSCWSGIEVHYGDLINKRGAGANLTEEQRKDFADKVFKLIFQVEPTLFGIVIIRYDILKHIGDLKVLDSYKDNVIIPIEEICSFLHCFHNMVQMSAIRCPNCGTIILL